MYLCKLVVFDYEYFKEVKYSEIGGAVIKVVFGIMKGLDKHFLGEEEVFFFFFFFFFYYFILVGSGF